MIVATRVKCECVFDIEHSFQGGRAGQIWFGPRQLGKSGEGGQEAKGEVRIFRCFFYSHDPDD